MGKIIFFFLAIAYAVASGLGVLHRTLPVPYGYAVFAVVLVILLVYGFKKSIRFSHSIFVFAVTNLAVQISGGQSSPIFVLYFLALPVVCFREKIRPYALAVIVLIVVEAASAVIRHDLSLTALAALAVAAMIAGLIQRQWTELESYLKRSLLKYESREQFFSRAIFKESDLATSVKEIDRHDGIERPLLYHVKFIHTILKAHTTALFTKVNDHLVLVQGFSRSELFIANAILDLSAGIYRQVIAENKSVLIKEFTQNPQELGYYRHELKIASVMIAPVVLMDKIEGLLVIDRKQEPFTEEDKEAFDQAVGSIGYILGMLRLYEKERYESVYMKTISHVAERLQRGLDLRTILDATVKDFKKDIGCDDISIASVDELNNQGLVLISTYLKEHTKFSLDDGLAGLVGRHKSTILKEDLSKGDFTILKKGSRHPSQSFIGVPVKAEDEIMGVLWLEDHRPHRFSEDDTEPLGILASQLSLAWQRAKLHEQVKEQSIRDGLTGLFNHRHFQELLEEEIGKRREFVLLLFDIDHFKKVNDTYGHQAGDKVLEFLGHLILQTGISARYGGEEFAIILPGSNIKKGIEQAVRLKDHLMKNDIKFDQIRIKITLSIGIACFPKDAKTRMDLIEKADRALYNAKETGRDRAILAQSLAKNEKRKS